MIYMLQLGEAVGWKRRSVTDDNVRRALAQLFDGGYLIETRAGAELTPKGETYIYGDRAS
jgi:hypothetical protein